MSTEDWYRGSNWSDSTKQKFFERLNRSRSSYHKAQYARIKAYDLAKSSDDNLIKEAMILLDTVIEKWPEKSELASCYYQMAECYIQLGDTDNAIHNFELCLLAQEEYPNSKTSVSLAYPKFIIEKQLKPLYKRANQVLEEHKTEAMLLFPVSSFIYHSVKAIIFEEDNNHEDAIKHANLALESSKLKSSGFSYHSKLGLVDTKKYKYLSKKINEILNQ